MGRPVPTRVTLSRIGTVLLAGWIFCAASAAAANGSAAMFEDGLSVEKLEDDPFVPRLRLTAQLRFRQSDGRIWTTPANTVLDGRSVPTMFVQLIGHPFDSAFPRTAISYDYAVKSKQQSWQAAQRMFFEGAVVEGVTPIEAKVMYLLLSASGSRWALRGPNSCFSRCHTDAKELEWRPRVNDEKLASLINWVRAEDPSLDLIEQRGTDAIIEKGPHIFGVVR